jgi:hypothetical protein
MSLHDVISDSSSDDSSDNFNKNKAQEAQLVEQKIEDFPVVSSSLTLGNKYVGISK